MGSINRIEQIERLNVKRPHEWIADHGDGWLFYHLHDNTLDSYPTRGAASPARSRS